MTTSTSELQILLTAKDQISGTLKTIGGAIVATFAVDKIIDFGRAFVDAFAKAESQTAIFNNNLKNLVGTTAEVATGQTKVVQSSKLSALAQKELNDKIKEAEISIRQQNLAVLELEKSDKKGKDAKKNFSIEIDSHKQKVESLNTQIQKYKEQLGEVDTKTVAVTRSVKITAEAVQAAKVAFEAASKAAVKLGFDDEDAALSMSRFFQATGSATEAIKLHSIAMDLARARNIDYATAANLVNQVLAGNGKILKQYQINLKESASPLEALEELQKKVAGSATAASKTFAVQAEVLRLNFENLEEVIGGALVRGIQPFVQELNTWASNPDVQLKIEEIATGLGDFMTNVLPVAIETIKLWKGAFDTVVDVLSSIYVWLDRVQQRLASVGSAIAKSSLAKSIGSAVVSTLTLGAVNFRAAGGPVSANAPYIVGEQGPELFVPKGSGNIIPNGGSVGGGSVVVNISGNFYTDSQQAERFGNQIAKILGQQLKLRTR